MIETDILTALQKAAIAAIAALAVPLPIQAVARTGGPTPATEGAYFEFVQIPNNRSGDYWDDSRIHQGNFRIILHWPSDDQGAYPPMAIMDQIGAFFPKGKMFASGLAVVKIYDVPQSSGMIPGNGSELLFPLSLPYRCFAA